MSDKKAGEWRLVYMGAEWQVNLAAKQRGMVAGLKFLLFGDKAEFF